MYSLQILAVKEREIVERIKDKFSADSEVRLWDGTRVDLLSDTLAIEVDWAWKWAEAIGQALYYAAVSGKKPGIVLMRTSKTDMRYIFRCQTVAALYDIQLFVEEVDLNAHVTSDKT